MPSESPRSGGQFDALRRQAEELLARDPPAAAGASTDLAALLYELNIHQAELELQNQELRRAQGELAALQHEYSDLYEFAPFGYLLLNAKGLITRANLRACRLLDTTKLELMRSTLSTFLTPAATQTYVLARRRAWESDETLSVELQLARQGQRTVWVQANLLSEHDDHGNLAQTRVALLDISARRRAEAQALETGARLDAALSSMHEGIFIGDARGESVHMNQAWATLHRCAGTEDCDARRVGHALEMRLPNGELVPASQWPIPRALNGETALDQDYRLGWKDGDGSRMARYNLAPMRDAHGGINGAVVSARDVTDLLAHEAELKRVAQHDPITELPNRLLLADRLEQAIALAERTGNALAVCHLDLDGFGTLNDEFGRDVGDRFLIETAARLRHLVRSHDSVARTGGDEFVLLLSELQQSEDCYRLLERVLAELSQPVRLGDSEYSLSASIGVTLYPDDRSGPDALLRHAGQALARAKAAGKDRFQLFDAEEDRVIRAHRQLSDELARAIERSELVLYFQPQVDLVRRKVVGAEALIRWQHPHKGLLPPAAFIPAMAGSAIETAIGDWVITTALDQLEQWSRLGIRLRLGVNIGPGQLLADGFAGRLRQQLAEHPGVAAGDLELEILESTAFDDFEPANRAMNACRALGVRFALDDFGTGYSSLAHFRSLPIDRLKIDQGFVRDMLHDPGDLEIVESVVRLARAFDREVIAEGVETPEHASLLPALQCRVMQGYGIARPMPAERLPEWIATWERQAVLPLVEDTWGRDDIHLVVAVQAYLHWADGVTHSLQQTEGPVADQAVADQCAFGRWYRGRGAASYGRFDAYPTVGSVHARSHALASELRALARDGQRESAQARLAELEALRAEFLAAVGDLMRDVHENKEAQRPRHGVADPDRE